MHADVPQNHFEQTMKEMSVELNLEDGRFSFFDRSVAEKKDSNDSYVIEVDSPNKTETLMLTPNSVRADDFKVYYYNSDHKKIEFIPQAPKTYRGSLKNQQDSKVSASITDDGLFAIVNDPYSGRWITQPVSKNATGSDNISLQINYFEKDINETPRVCGVDHTQQNFSSNQFESKHDSFDFFPNISEIYSKKSNQQSSEIKQNENLCHRIAEIAIDVDYEFFLLNSLPENSLQQNIQRTIDDVEMLMNKVSNTYESKFGIQYEITRIVVRSTPSDPYFTTNANGLLNELTLEWLTNQASSTQDVTHLFTGKDIQGDTIGIAYLEAVCNTAFQFGLSQSRFTEFISLRAALTEHELGHNWGAMHCDDDPDCFNMCSQIGGCTGVINNFGDTSFGSILDHRNKISCLTPTTGSVESTQPIAIQDQEFVPAVPVILDLLANDLDLDCDIISIDSVSAMSFANADLTLYDDGQGFQGVVYDPTNRTTDLDQFSYNIIDDDQRTDGTTVLVDVLNPDIFELDFITITNTIGEPVVVSWQTSSESITGFAYR